MSEAERKKRLSYKENRKRWIFIQGIALIVVAVLIFASLITYNQLNKEYYINYTESSVVDYKVKIAPGTSFYEEYKDYYANENGEVWLKSGEAYPASAVEIIIADVNYELSMDARDVDYEYSYRIFATAEVVDSVTKNKFNMPVLEIKDSSTHRQNSNNKLYIHEQIPVDYNGYNEMVKSFTKQLGITKSTSTLVVTMEVNVIGTSSDFASNSQNRHAVKISVPLTEQSFKVDYSSSIPTGESKVLAYKNAGNQHLYKGAAITLGSVEILLFAIFIAFVYLTRNHDVNYSIKVQKLVNSYRSFIQKVTNGFNAKGYQILEIATFKEMLAIRDTIQAPVLMSENIDQTRTQFFIPTNTKILYLFEIKVENYDELYGSHPEWVDDSLITTESLTPENEEVNTGIPVVEEAKNSSTDGIVLQLLAEIEKLKAGIRTPAEPGASSSKIGNFSAQGNVIINYNEQPSEEIIAAAAKKVAETLTIEKEDENPEERNSPELTPPEEELSVVKAETEQENDVNPTLTEEADTLAEAIEVISRPSTEAEEMISEVKFDEVGEIIIPESKQLNIHCKRSFIANIMQSDPHKAKLFYSEIKNYILSYKGVKSRTAWRYESYNKGRNQLFRIRLRGKSICLYCALDPSEVDESRYFHDVATAKDYGDVPTMVKIKTPRGLKRAMELVDAVMQKFEIQKNPKAKALDYLEIYPFKKTAELVEMGLVKILSDTYKIKEPKAPKKTAPKRAAANK